MSKKRKPTTDALEILHRRYYEGKPDRIAALEEAEANDAVARKIYDLRTKAGLTQRQLAKLVGTSASVICLLEDADYEGHSMAMLNRIAAALNRRVEIRFVPVKGKTICALGLSFKPNTDDLRESPALAIIPGLRRRGVRVRAFDPVAIPHARKHPRLHGIEFVEDAYETARGADALVIVTEWNEFRGMNLARLKRLMRRPVLCDLRNVFDPDEVRAAGIRHVGVGTGRPST